MKPIIVGLLFISLGMTSFAALPMNVSAENNLTSVNEEEKITDLEKIHNILYKNLSEQKLTREVSLFEDSNGKELIIVLARGNFDEVSKAVKKVIDEYNIDPNCVMVYPVDNSNTKTNLDKFKEYIKKNNIDAIVYQFGYHPSVAYYEEDTATIEAIDAFLKKTSVNGLKRIAYKGSKPEGGMITDYAFIYEKLYQLIEEKKINAVIWMALNIDGQFAEANSREGYNGDFSSVTSMRLSGTYAEDEKSIAAVEKMFAEENIDPMVIEWWMLEGGSVNNAVQGDANCDGEMSMADAVLIMQYIANPAKYGIEGTNENHITEQGKKNADIAGENDGVTNADALAIQKKLLKLD